MEDILSVKRKLQALLSYFPILFFFPLILLRKDDFVHYHAKQGVVLFVILVLIIFSFWLPVVSWVFLLAYLVIFVTGAINVLTGKMEPIPVFGRIAERLSI